VIGARVVGSPGRRVAGGFLFSGVRAVRPPGRWVRIAAGPLGRRVPRVVGSGPLGRRVCRTMTMAAGSEDPAARHKKAEARFLDRPKTHIMPGGTHGTPSQRNVG